jgi:hypothetical protein
MPGSYVEVFVWAMVAGWAAGSFVGAVVNVLHNMGEGLSRF